MTIGSPIGWQKVQNGTTGLRDYGTSMRVYREMSEYDVNPVTLLSCSPAVVKRGYQEPAVDPHLYEMKSLE
jgi:hypothetical protein